MGGFTSRDQCSPVTGFSGVADWCVAHTDNTWVRLHDCDRPVAFGGQVNCTLRHHQADEAGETVKRRALSSFCSLWFCFVSWKSLCMVLPFATWQTSALYMSLFRASHYSSKQLVFYFVSSHFCEVMPFYQSNRIAAVFEWPGPHTYTPRKLYR